MFAQDPTSHVEHDVSPAAAVYVAPTQGEHIPAPSEFKEPYSPGLQREHSVDPPLDSVVEPGM